jgi:hypothetical protein
MPTLELLTRNKAFYAWLGANDLVAEKVREQLKTTPTKVQNYTTALSEQAGALYEELVTRGEKVVSAVRRSPEVAETESAAEFTTREAKGAARAAGHTVRAAEGAAKASTDKIG